jgi:hypothetical protein
VKRAENINISGTFQTEMKNIFWLVNQGKGPEYTYTAQVKISPTTLPLNKTRGFLI